MSTNHGIATVSGSRVTVAKVAPPDRAAIATAAMAALIQIDKTSPVGVIAARAVRFADSLIAQLAKEPGDADRD